MTSRVHECQVRVPGRGKDSLRPLRSVNSGLVRPAMMSRPRDAAAALAVSAYAVHATLGFTPA